MRTNHEELLENSAKDVEAAWADEIEKRVNQLESGEVETVPWEDVRVRIRTGLAKAKLKLSDLCDQ